MSSLFNIIYTDTLTKFTDEDNLVKPILHFVIVTLKNDKTSDITDERVIDVMKTTIKNQITKQPSDFKYFAAHILYTKYLKAAIVEDDVNFFVDKIYEKIYSHLSVDKAIKLFFGI